jgi:hypothetical protein
MLSWQEGGGALENHVSFRVVDQKNGLQIFLKEI